MSPPLPLGSPQEVFVPADALLDTFTVYPRCMHTSFAQSLSAVPHSLLQGNNVHNAELLKAVTSLLKHLASATELSVSPDVKDWCRRLLSTLNGLGGNAISDSYLGNGNGTSGGGGTNRFAGLAGLGGALAPAFVGKLEAQGTSQAEPLDSAAPSGEAAPTPDGAPASSQFGLRASWRADDASWGFPFSGPKAAVMAGSRRVVRQDALSQALRISAHKADSRQADGAVPSLDDTRRKAVGVCLSLDGQTGLTLDNRSLWRALGGNHDCWEQLSGPSDPLMLSAKYCIDRDDPVALQVQLKAENRCGSGCTPA